MFMPLDFLLRLLSNLTTIVLVGGGSYILYQWYEGNLVSDRWLYLGIGLLLWSFLGFLPILLLHRSGRDEPTPLRSNRVQRLVRPDGSEIQTEISGFTGTETRGQLNFSSLIGIKASPGVLARGALAMFKFDETVTLPTISVPTLVVVGKSDIATRPVASKRISAEIPQAELSVLSPGGHMALMERNQQFAEIIRGFSNSCLKLKK